MLSNEWIYKQISLLSSVFSKHITKFSLTHLCFSSQTFSLPDAPLPPYSLSLPIFPPLGTITARWFGSYRERRVAQEGAVTFVLHILNPHGSPWSRHCNPILRMRKLRFIKDKQYAHSILYIKHWPTLTFLLSLLAYSFQGAGAASLPLYLKLLGQARHTVGAPSMLLNSPLQHHWEVAELGWNAAWPHSPCSCHIAPPCQQNTGHITAPFYFYESFSAALSPHNPPKTLSHSPRPPATHVNTSRDTLPYTNTHMLGFCLYLLKNELSYIRVCVLLFSFNNIPENSR